MRDSRLAPPYAVRMSWLTPPSVAGAAVLLSVLARALGDRLWDPDLWWHLETGRIIVERHAVPTADPFSFTAAGNPWIVQEWGSEVALRGIESALGLRGIIVWRGLMLLLVYALVARLFVREAGNRLGTWAVVALTAFAGAASWAERPNLFSFLLFVVTLGLLSRRDRRIWWFVPIAVLWANLHGMVLLGIGLVSLVAAAEGLKVAFAWEGADRAWARRLALVAAGGLAASLLNPAGPRLIGHAFRLVRIVSPVVTEWASPDFHDPAPLLFLALVLLAIAGVGLSSRRADPTDVALLAGFVTLGLFAVRNLPVAAIVVGYVASRNWLPLVREVLAGRRVPAAGAPPPGMRVDTPRVPVGLAAVNLTLVLAVATVFGVRIADRLPASGSIAEAVDPVYPRTLMTELRGTGVRLFTRDAWAGFALYLHWPRLRVAIDTRADFYGLDAVRRYQRIYAGAPEWEGTFERLCVTHVLIEERSGLAKAMQADPVWALRGSEPVASSLAGGTGTALLFVPRSPAPGCAGAALSG